MSQRKLQLWYFSYKAYLIDLTTFLIFTLDIYTAGTDSHEIFDVYLNANMKLDTIELSTLFDYFPAPLETIVHRAAAQMKMLHREIVPKKTFSSDGGTSYRPRCLGER